MDYFIYKSAVVIAAAVACASIARANVVVVDAKANIYGAGHASAPAPGGGSAGILPPSISFAAGSALNFTIASISGTVSLSPRSSSNGNGTPTYGSTDIEPYNGISGIINKGRSGFLVGVFLNNIEPIGPTPSKISFNAPDDFSEISPLLRQTFLIGDGINDTSGQIQKFVVPSGATRLFLGFADAYSYHGLPGQYQDNSGSLSVDVQISSVPEPASLGLMIIGILCVCGIQRKKNSAGSSDISTHCIQGTMAR